MQNGVSTPEIGAGGETAAIQQQRVPRGDRRGRKQPGRDGPFDNRLTRDCQLNSERCLRVWIPVFARTLLVDIQHDDWANAGLCPIKAEFPDFEICGERDADPALMGAKEASDQDIILVGSTGIALSSDQLKLVGQLVRNSRDDELVVLRCVGGDSRPMHSMKWRDRILRILVHCLLGHSVIESDLVVVAGPAKIMSGLLRKIGSEPSPQAILTEARVAGVALQIIETANRGSAGSAGPTGGAVPGWRSMAGQLDVSFRSWWNRALFPYRPSTGEPSASGFLSRRIASLMIMALFAVVLFGRLGYPLFEPDEARNAQLALNAIETGEWTSLQLLGKPYWDKPPFQTWMTVAAYRLFGKSPWSTRFPCVVMGLLTVVAVMTLGAKLTNRGTANLASLLLLGCLGFAVVSRYATMDATLCCLATWIILWILLEVRRQTSSSLSWAGIGALTGVALLAKGLAIVAIAFPPTLVYFWLRRESLTLPSRKALLFGAMSGFAIAGPWYLAMSFFHPDFAAYFFGKHHLLRFANAFDHKEPWWYYFPVAWILTYPSSLLLPILAGSWWYGKVAWRSQLPQVTDGLLLYAVWIFSFFSMAEAKLPTYILPMLPVTCLLSAITLRFAPWRLIAERKNKSVTEWKLGLARTVLASIGLVQTIGLLIVGLMYRRTLDDQSLQAIMALEVAVLVLIAIGMFSTSMRWRSAFALASCESFVGTAVLIAVPTVSTQKSTLHALALQANLIGHRPVVYYGRPPFATEMLECELDIHHFDDEHPEAAARFLAYHPNAILVAGGGGLRRIEEELGSTDAFLSINGHRRLYEIPPDDRSLMVRRFRRIEGDYQIHSAGQRTAESPELRR